MGPSNGIWATCLCSDEGSDTPSLSRHHLPIVPQLGIGYWGPFLHPCLHVDRVDLIQVLCE